MKTIRIIPPTLADIETMWRWGQENWEMWGDEKNKWYSKKSLERWILDPKDDVLLVARDEDTLVGMCMVSVMRDWAFCFGLFVEKEHRGQGIGKQLLDEASKILDKKHVGSYSLLVDTKNMDAVRFYQREGFYKGYEFFLMTKDVKEEA